MDDLARSSWNLISSGPSSGPEEEADATSSVEDRTGSARAPGEEEPPALELPEREPLVFRVGTHHGAPTRKTNS